MPPSATTGISGNGRKVAFCSYATNQAPGDTSAEVSLFVRDLDTGAIERVDATTAGGESATACDFALCDLDYTGRRVVFASRQTDIVDVPVGVNSQIYLRDTESDETTVVARTIDGLVADNQCYYPTISSDGRWVSFVGNASNLVEGDTNVKSDVFLRDMQGHTMERLSLNENGVQLNGSTIEQSLGASATVVAFNTKATNIVEPYSSSSFGHIYLRDFRSDDPEPPATSTVSLTSTSKNLTYFGQRYTLTGVLRSGGTGLAGTRVRIQTSSTTSGLKDSMTATTAANGTFSVSVLPRNRTYYRVYFPGDGGDWTTSPFSIRTDIRLSDAQTVTRRTTCVPRNVAPACDPSLTPGFHPWLGTRYNRVPTAASLAAPPQSHAHATRKEDPPAMLNERRQRVLQALVEEYISSATPVGSKTLVTRYELGCSPATVRNELSILEETGYVIQPHVSAGRMPTDTGYRNFVDDLIERSRADLDSPVETARVTHAAEVDELMRETSVALTRLTDCLAVTIAPSVTISRVKRLDLLSMAPRRALFVLITESGQVVNRPIELAEEAAPESLAAMERALNAAVVGKRAREIRPLRDALATPGAKTAAEDAALMGRVLDEILDALDEADRDRLFHVGVPALLSQPEFHDADRAAPIIEFLEDGLSLLEALSEALTTRDITVRIGHENQRVELGNVSIVASSYSSASGEGLVGVVGPTRMDYERAMGAVRMVARELSDAMRGD